MNQNHPLKSLFSPRSVAIIGAGEKNGSLGRVLMANMIAAKFQGAIYPINPRYHEILGIKSYPSILKTPEPADLAVIATPAKTVPSLVSECAAAGVKMVIVISAGFKETGNEGAQLEQEVLEHARKGGIRILGPNCLGCMNPHVGLNATFAAGIAHPGDIAFISQSGALCTAVLDWSLQHEVGFSAFVSVGSMSDIDWGDLIGYLGEDRHTRAIIMYLETVGNAESFLKAAKSVAPKKPICVIKAGRTQAAAKAAASHTGSLAGSDDVFSAAMQQTGILRVDTIEEIFDLAMCLGRQPLPKGPHLTIVTNAGGPAVLSTDAAVLHGAKMTELTPEAEQALSAILPAAWSHGNPIDVLGDADASRYATALKLGAEDHAADGLLVILTPQDMTDAEGTAKQVVEVAQKMEKPLLTSWMGGAAVIEGEEILRRAGIPCFAYPDAAARTFATLWCHQQQIDRLYGNSPAKAPPQSTVQEKVHRKLEVCRARGETILTETESKEILTAYQIPVVRNILAESESEAVQAAEEIGFPIVLKLHSSTITHKTDVGGVKLNLQTKEEVKSAFREIRASVAEKAGVEHFQGVAVQKMVRLKGTEIIFGSSVDSQWGPVILFGAGGELVEVYHDRSLGLPPLDHAFARQMIEQTKIYQVLQGARGRNPVDLDQLVKLLVQFSSFIYEQPLIAECDINPLLVSDEGIIALDARIVLSAHE